MPDLLADGYEAFEKNVTLYNESVDQYELGSTSNDKQASESEVQEVQASEFQELEGRNERVNEIFNTARELAFAENAEVF